MRNDMVFNNKVFDSSQLMDNIKLRIAFWFKAKWLGCDESFVDIVRFPNIIKVPSRVKFITEVKLQKSPPFDSLKSSVDGFFEGKLGSIGIDGVLKDYMVAVKIVFPKAIEMVDYNVVELFVSICPRANGIG